jgi:outer membrane lipoprotein-sorting protein
MNIRISLRGWRVFLHPLACAAALAWILLAGGCAVSQKRTVAPGVTKPSLAASKEELLAKYNQQARAVRSLNAGVAMSPTAGSAYSGVIEQYHEVDGFLLARRPADIRVIGQAPVVGKNIFDMVSDGNTFRIFIPSRGKFITGPTNLDRSAARPIENLRPQHLLDALFWIEVPEKTPVLLEEADSPAERDYNLTVARSVNGNWELDRKIWFNRADLQVSRLQIYGPSGSVFSDVRYADWQGGDAARFPRHIWLERPQEDYRLEIQINKLTLNETITDEQFRLEQPPGAELVRLGTDAGETKP